MAEGSPPPWLINMQRYGPPPSYPELKVSPTSPKKMKRLRCQALIQDKLPFGLSLNHCCGSVNNEAVPFWATVKQLVTYDINYHCCRSYHAIGIEYQSSFLSSNFGIKYK